MGIPKALGSRIAHATATPATRIIITQIGGRWISSYCALFRVDFLEDAVDILLKLTPMEVLKKSVSFGLRHCSLNVRVTDS